MVLPSEVETFLREKISQLLGFFGLTPEFTFVVGDNVVTIGIKTEHDDLFMAADIQPVLALQHVVRVMMRKQFPDLNLSVAIDLDNFHAQQDARLKTIATQAAAQARLTKTTVHLEPMTSYERRIIHLYLANEPDVTSESMGEEPHRYVAVKSL